MAINYGKGKNDLDYDLDTETSQPWNNGNRDPGGRLLSYRKLVPQQL